MNHSLSYELTFGLAPKYTYCLLLFLSLAGPVFLSFDKKVAFYKEWRYLWKPTALVSIGYIVWDVFFTKIGVWEFNKQFLIDVFISELPIEEYGFFFVIPYASAFVYACLRAYFPQIPNTKNSWFSFILIALSILIMAYASITWYTWTTCGLLLISILYWDIWKKTPNTQYIYLAWIVCIIPMLYVNGILTGKPVLIYNNLENCKVRIGTIPLEDFFYHLLYMVWMLNLYQYWKTQNLKTKAK